MNLIFLGPPGAGKGTQAKLISEKFEVPQISTGDILRSAVRDQSPMGIKAKEYMDAGALVPDEVVVGIVEERLSRQDCENGFILDGFPRTVAQANSLKQTLLQLGKVIDHVILIKVDNEDLVARITGRRTCDKCGKGYHILYDPPKNGNVCDACGGGLYQRDDDKEDTMRNRLLIYNNLTQPLIEYYSKESVLRTVEGSGGIECIQGKIISMIKGNV